MSQQEKHQTTTSTPTTAAVAAKTPAASNLKIRGHPIQASEAGASSSDKQPASKTTAKQMASSRGELAKTQTKLVANLHSAADEGKFELVRLLLRCGADVNAQDDEFGNTALHQAAWNGFSQTVQVLCKYRANTSIRNKAQFTPLHMACQQGHNQTVRLLLMANAKTEAKNSYGDTPLHTAARYGHAGAARILLSAKCNPNPVNKSDEEQIRQEPLKQAAGRVIINMVAVTIRALVSWPQNHDTPLHIAAAMGRRKLTKIFMQNGAEPAIKNKQGETAMDIALRKDLIDIQELIANPPPTKPSRSSRMAAAESHAQHLGQLEQRYGPLYASRSNRATAAAKPGKSHHPHHHSHHRHSQQQLQHNLGQSSEDNCSSSRLLGAQMSRLNLGQHKQQAEHHQVELAVDVPGSDQQRAKLTSRSSKFASAHSLGPLQQLNHQNHQPSSRRQRHLRTKTLSGVGAELGLLAAGRYGAGSGSQARSALQATVSAADLNEQEGGEVCLPDARPDKTSKWAEIMAKSGRFQGSGENSPTAASPVIEFDVDEDEDNLAEGIRLNGTKSASPGAGSLRSSLSKSRCRPVVLRRLNRKRGSGNKLLARRSNNLGKLSLLRLRTMVHRHKSAPVKSESDQLDEATKNESGDEADDETFGEAKLDEQETATTSGATNHQSCAKQQNSGGQAKDAAAAPGEKRPPMVRFGRRQERLERLREEEAGTIQLPQQLQRAPNGNKLQATRPLAPLNDESQLYAIPRKKKQQQHQEANKQQVPAANIIKNCDQVAKTTPTDQLDLDNGSSKRLEPAPDRVPSGGPALTSDGCHSSDGSSFARASPPSSSSAMASSSDECIESLDLICVASSKQRQNNCKDPGAKHMPPETQRPPAIVGVHSVASASADELLDLYAPGYSVIREPPHQRQQPPERAVGRDTNNGPSETYVCGDDLQEAPTDHVGQAKSRAEQVKSSAAAQTKPPATKTGSRLRQLLHLEPKSKTTEGRGSSCAQQAETAATKTAHGTNTLANGRLAPVAGNTATGYYAYSPVVQSSSELVILSRQQQLAAREENKTVGGQLESTRSQPAKKSWLMSRFSLSSGNLANHQASKHAIVNDHSKDGKTTHQQDRPAQQVESPTTESGIDIGTTSSIDSSALQGPERRAELITIKPDEDTASDNLASAGDGIVTIENGDGLIRPKSAISGGNSELIAAQKSLAAAAAAKVKRDRLFKVSSAGGCDDSGQQLQQIVANHQQQNGSSSNGALTVKTSDPFWGAHHPLVLANGAGQKYLIGGHQQAANHHRSGTNSVGMSDSSPSNNGAESDNSIQTTSGSMNTDNTSGGQLSASESQQNSSPLGILSRILLNSKSAGAIRQVANSLHSTGRESINNSSGSTLRNGRSGGSLSSSALSSPASNERQSSPGTTMNTEPVAAVACQKLDQLESRSRCPIVLARSNELVDSDRQPANKIQQEPAPAPRWPAKSALKTPAAGRTQQVASGAGIRPPSMEPMNGLPRVASYTQISTMEYPTSGPYNGHLTHNDLSRQQSLCNYHAMNRNHQIQTQYSPYLPYALGRYSIHGACEPTMAGGKCAPAVHLSHHDLRDSGNQLDLTLPASAINYEYYLEPPINAPQQHQPHFNGCSGHPNPRSHLYQSYANGTHTIYPQTTYAHDDSIYIPYGLGDVRDTSSLGLNGSTRPATAMASAIPGALITNGHKQQQIFGSRPNQAAQQHPDLHRQHHHNLVGPSAMVVQRRPPLPAQQLQQRPKSSLDTFLQPGAGSATNPLPPLPTTPLAADGHANGRLQHHPAAASAGQQQNRVPALSSPLANDTVVVGGSHQSSATGRDYPSPIQSAASHQKQPSSYSYASSPYMTTNHQASGYIYSQENSIYASDQSALQHSDLTVLPTTTESNSPAAADIIKTHTASSSAASYRHSPSVKALTEGGNGNLDNGTFSIQVNSTSTTPTTHSSPAGSIKAASNKQQVDTTRNSLTPSTPFRSLVQVNHPSSASSKSNQSSLTKLEEGSTLSSVSLATIKSVSPYDDQLDDDNKSTDFDGDRRVDTGSRITISNTTKSSDKELNDELLDSGDFDASTVL